ncbi:MAG: D-alanine--D-alanine ligase [Cyanobacteria bacterium RUI128]|nr:D-alanine--D-alanine ligase [Cyanobacteria bacterium RUI128]
MQTNIQKDAKIAVLCGGLSSERDVSLRSGKNCYEALIRLGYKNAKLIDVTENIASDLKGFDFAYNALHGKYGEDGCIQGILEIMKIPYTGCGVMSSAIAMNKEFTKRVLRDAGLPLIKSVCVSKGDNLFAKTKDLTYPLMIKPVCEGSSFGMSKVNNQDELVKAVFEASKFKQDILIEEYKVGSDATVGVLERDGEPFATDVLEMRPHNEWYDYEAKYTKGLTDFIVPGEFSEEMTKMLKKYAIGAFKACGCSGVSRVDFVVTKDLPYILEVNTSPGMTDTSDLPAQSASMGISYDELVELILKSAGLNK